MIVASRSSRGSTPVGASWAGYNTFYGRTLPGEITDVTWARFFDASETVRALVAEKDGELLGLAHDLFHRSTILIGLTCYLQDLFTAAHARGQGVGGALIEASLTARGKAELPACTGIRRKRTPRR